MNAPETTIDEINYLLNSIKHLERTCVELEVLINGEEFHDDEELILAIVENKDTISAQKEKVERLKKIMKETHGIDLGNAPVDSVHIPTDNREEKDAGIHL